MSISAHLAGWPVAELRHPGVLNHVDHVLLGGGQEHGVRCVELVAVEGALVVDQLQRAILVDEDVLGRT